MGDIRTDEHGTKFFTGFSMTIPPSGEKEAIDIAKGKGNRVADYLGSIHDLPVQACLYSITEIRPKGEFKTGIAMSKFHGNAHRPVDLDLSNVKNFLMADEKILRQVAHYNSGLRSSDPIKQFDEFYLVLEDKYGNHSQYLEKYKFLRDASVHPELDKGKESKQQLLNEIGTPYLDPSSPEAQKLIEKNLINLKQDAAKIIRNILKNFR